MALMDGTAKRGYVHLTAASPSSTPTEQAVPLAEVQYPFISITRNSSDAGLSCSAIYGLTAGKAKGTLDDLDCLHS